MIARGLTLLAGACVAFVGCAHLTGPDRSKGYGGSPATVAVGDVPVTGHEVSVEAGGETVEGELLGLDATNLYVLADRRTVSVPRWTVSTVRIRLYDSASTAAGIWTTLGTVSTISHGYFLVFSAPIWLATGIPTTVVTANRARLRVGSDQLDPLSQFARFPQGLPLGWPGRMITREEVLRQMEEAERRASHAVDAGADAGADAGVEAAEAQRDAAVDGGVSGD